LARVLALDYGSARCGVALSDPTGVVVRPLPVVERPGTRRGFGAVLGLVREHGVRTVVVGLPLSLSGADSDQTRETRAFAERLQERVGKRVAVLLHDERFTTRMAERFGGEGDEDSRAAAHLLEGWLQAQAGGQTPS
jgi:putative Holliday junction resolvase